MINLFGKTKILEREVESYLLLLQRSALVFNEAINEYMGEELEFFEKRVDEIVEVENEAESLRKDIKNKLYKFMLIPGARGDVWELLRSLSKILNIIKKVLKNFYYEKPEIPKNLKKHFLKISDYTQKAVNELANATKAYFTNYTMVIDFTNKVLFYEEEVDKIEDLIKEEVFCRPEEMLERLSHRIQLRYFAEKIAQVTDSAEIVCDKLSVFVMKREI